MSQLFSEMPMASKQTMIASYISSNTFNVECFSVHLVSQNILNFDGPICCSVGLPVFTSATDFSRRLVRLVEYLKKIVQVVSGCLTSNGPLSVRSFYITPSLDHGYSSNGKLPLVSVP